MAAAIERASGDLVNVFADDQLMGDAFDAAREVAEEVADRVGRAWERYDGVARALTGWSGPLESAQRRADALLEQATALRGDRDGAEQTVNRYESEQQQAAMRGDAEEVQRLEPLLSGARGRQQSAAGDIASLVSQLQGVIDDYERDGNAAADLIEEVQDSGDLNDGFWENVGQWFDENPWVDVVLNVVGTVVAVLTVLAMFVPGLNVIMGALLLIGAIITAVSVVVTTLQVLGGNKSLVEGLISVGLSLIPLRIGKGLDFGLEFAKGTVRTSAATSIHMSAVSMRVPGQTLESSQAMVSAVAARVRPGQATEYAELLRMQEIANMGTWSGNPLAAAQAAAASGSRAFWGTATNTVAPAMSSWIPTSWIPSPTRQFSW